MLPLSPPRQQPRFLAAFSLAVLSCLLGTPAQARESLGIYGSWGAFRDPLIPRCYAIAMASPNAKAREYQPFAAIGTWPKRGTRNQIHFRLSRQIRTTTPITLYINGQRVLLTGGGGDAWPRNVADNATVSAALRTSKVMSVSAYDTKGLPFNDRWELAGAASAMDAALLGCARIR